jgi:hypothetical protein
MSLALLGWALGNEWAWPTKDQHGFPNVSAAKGASTLYANGTRGHAPTRRGVVISSACSGPVPMDMPVGYGYVHRGGNVWSSRVAGRGPRTNGCPWDRSKCAPAGGGRWSSRVPVVGPYQWISVGWKGCARRRGGGSRSHRGVGARQRWLGYGERTPPPTQHTTLKI